MAGSHKLTLLSIEKGVQTDGVLQTQQNEKRNLLTASRQNLKGMTDAFHNVQMEKFQDISGIESSLEKTENGHAGFSIKSKVLIDCKYNEDFICISTINHNTKLQIYR